MNSSSIGETCRSEILKAVATVDQSKTEASAKRYDFRAGNILGHVN